MAFLANIYQLWEDGRIWLNRLYYLFVFNYLNNFFCFHFRQTGDKSLANVIAHEIAHSWSGNLVTSKNFEHFWLNEGFTRFMEDKIMGRMFGDNVRHLSGIGGWKKLKDSVCQNLALIYLLFEPNFYHLQSSGQTDPINLFVKLGHFIIIFL